MVPRLVRFSKACCESPSPLSRSRTSTAPSKTRVSWPRTTAFLLGSQSFHITKIYCQHLHKNHFTLSLFSSQIDFGIPKSKFLRLEPSVFF